MGNPRSLRSYVVAAALLAGLLPLAVLGVAGVIETRVAIKHFEETVAAQNRQTLTGAQFYLEAVLGSSRDELERVAQDDAFRQHRPDAYSALKDLQEQFPSLSFILALDRQDRPFSFWAKDRFVSAEKVVRVLPVVGKGKPGQTHYTRLFELPNGESVVALIYDYPEGFLVLGFDFVRFGDALTQASKGLASGMLFMVSANGLVIFETVPDQDWVGMDVGHLAVVQDVLKGGSGTVRASAPDLFPTDLLVTYGPVKKTGWGLLVATPVETMEEPLVRMYYVALAAFALAILAAMVLAVRGTRRVGELLDQHQQRLWKLAAGEEPPEVQAGDLEEFQAIDRAFHAMTERVHQDAEQRLMELQAAQNALVRSERFAAMGQLAAVLAHEIKNRFNVIKLGSQTLGQLLRDQGSPEEMNRLIQAVTRAVDRGNDLMVSLLRFTRPVPPHRELYQPNDVLLRALSVIQQPNVAVQTHLQPDLPSVLGDPAEMEQVVINVLLNCLQAMPEGGAILVTSRWEGDSVQLSIRDTGPGMSPEAQEHLFEPFYTTKERGTGLGMAIAKQIVESQGGQVAVDSVPGHGTTVRISLPVPQSADEAETG